MNFSLKTETRYVNIKEYHFLYYAHQVSTYKDYMITFYSTITCIDPPYSRNDKRVRLFGWMSYS